MWVPSVSDNSRITTALLLPFSTESNPESGKWSCASNTCSFGTHTAVDVQAQVPREVSSQPPWPAIFNTEFLTLSGYTKSAEGSCVSSMWRESSLHSLDTKNSLLQLSSQFGEIKDSPGFLISIFTRVSFPHCFCITKCTVAKYHPYVLQLKGSKLLSNLLPSELLTETTLTQQRSLVCGCRGITHLGGRKQRCSRRSRLTACSWKHHH